MPFDSKIYRTREEAESIPIELSGYRFDLDGDEAEGIEVTHPLYTVDSRLHGRLSLHDFGLPTDKTVVLLSR